MNELTYKHFEKLLRENGPMKLSPYDKSRPFKEGKRGVLKSKWREIEKFLLNPNFHEYIQ